MKKEVSLIAIVELVIATISLAMPTNAQVQNPVLKIEPSLYEASKIGETFNISVNIYNLQTSHRLTGVQFRVKYNSTLVEPLKTYEGQFLSQFNNTDKPPYTYFIVYIEDDPIYGPNVLIGILLIPNATGFWTNFPHGNGTLATITFKTISQVWWQQLSCDLILDDTLLINDSIEEIPHATANGRYQVQQKPLTISYSPSKPSAGEVVVFKAPKYWYPGYNIIYNWDFGDGTAMNTTEPSIHHVYVSPKDYLVTLKCIANNIQSNTTSVVVPVGFYLPLEVKIDAGSLHFRGEIVEFNVLTTHFGKNVNATKIEAILYYEGAVYADLSASIQYVDTGFYRVPYEIPLSAKAGTYTIMVKAEYYEVNGTDIKSFLISPTLTEWNAELIAINGTIAAIKTDTGVIKMNLTEIGAKLQQLKGTVVTISSTVGLIKSSLDVINASLVRLDGNIATINSTLGAIQTDVDDIHLKVVGIDWETKIATIQTTLGTIKGYVEDVNDGGLATINTSLGTVKADVSEIKGHFPITIDMTPAWIAAIFAILAFIAVIIALLKKK